MVRKNGGMRKVICQVLLGMMVMLVVPVWAGEAGPTNSVKEQIVKLLASITMKLNHAVDEKFCRQFFEDFRKQNKVEHIQPIIQADRIDDPKLAPFLSKCPTVKWIGADPDEPGSPLNSATRDQFGNRSVGTAHFRLYKVDINNNRKDGSEHVFYSDGYIPEPLPGEDIKEVEELDKTYGWYVVIDFEHCLTLGGVEAGRMGMHVKPVYNGIIQYQGRSYIYVLDAEGGYKLELNELTAGRQTFKTTCRYWQ